MSVEEFLAVTRAGYEKAMNEIRATMKTDGVDPTRLCRIVVLMQDFMAEVEAMAAEIAEQETES